MPPDPKADAASHREASHREAGMPEPVPGDRVTAEAEPEAEPVDETGLELARQVAGRVAAIGRVTGRRRRPAPGSDEDKRRRTTRRASAPDRVGGLVSSAPFTGPGADDNDPARLGSAVRDLLAGRGWTERTDASAVLARWPDLVGADTAAHCRPVDLDEGRLRVRADSSAWATQLRLLAPRLVTAVNDRVGSVVVTDLVVEGPVAPSWRHGRLWVQGGRGPRDTYG